MLHKVLRLVKLILYKGRKHRASEDWEITLSWWIKHEKNNNNEGAAITILTDPVSTSIVKDQNKGLDAVSL